ncbi:hypothetical protein BBROOKSOX_1109 [Bathymodiolus brooksi thiotrophic gill symbiont]|nr:hypothetical protein BBROOKSOX_1109 [Bathymodiolus brooksi thiotrophic gill symbiont]
MPTNFIVVFGCVNCIPMSVCACHLFDYNVSRLWHKYK